MAQRLKTDWILFLTVLTLVCFGLVMVYSSSSIVAELKYHTSGAHFFVRQFGWAVFSFLVLLYCMKRDYRRWNNPKIAFAALGMVVLLLLVVYITDGKNHRWLRAGVLSLQPSELAKPALALFLAFFLCRRLGAVNERYTLGPIAVIISALALFVAVADLGTAVVLVATTLTVIFVAGVDLKYLAFCGAMAILLGLVFIAMKPYRLARFIDFVDQDHKIVSMLDPNKHLLNYANKSEAAKQPGYQQLQAKLALGAGGFFGAGLMASKQKMLFLPEAHTDFIYAIIGEETGFIGAAGLLLGFIVVLWRGLRAALRANDQFGRYLALSVTVCVVIQALLNISVVLDMLPNKGLPLPFISTGGSSLMSTLILMGMLLSVSENTP